MSDRPPLIDKKFASRVDWNLMRTFIDIVRAGGIGAAIVWQSLVRTRLPPPPFFPETGLSVPQWGGVNLRFSLLVLRLPAYVLGSNPSLFAIFLGDARSVSLRGSGSPDHGFLLPPAGRHQLMRKPPSTASN